MTNISTLSNAMRELNRSTFDVAAGINERTLNDFFDAHWKRERQKPGGIYRGEGHLGEVGIRYAYNVKTPVSIDVSPLSQRAFARVFKGWASTVPELAAGSESLLQLPTGLNVPPPNFQIGVGNLSLTITTDTGIKVVLSVKIKVTGYVTTDNADDVATIRLIPIDARVEDQATILASIEKSIGPVNKNNKEDCVELRKLILYIVNVLIANRIGSFVKEFDIPLPLRLIDGVSITSLDLSVLEDTIFVKSTLDPTKVKVAASQIGEFVESRNLSEFEQVSAYVAGEYKSIRQVQSLRTSESGEAVRVTVSSLNRSRVPNKGLFLILHQRFFQILADKFLVYDQRKVDSGSWNGINYEVGTHLRAWNPLAEVVGSGLNVSANFEGRAWARAWIKTHCGDISKTVSASLSGRARLGTLFYFTAGKRQELWMQARLRSFPTKWRIGGLPFPLNKIIAFILTLLTNFVIAFAAAFGARWKTKLTSIPNKFPGTDIEFEPNFEQRVSQYASEKALMIAAEPDFKP